MSIQHCHTSKHVVKILCFQLSAVECTSVETLRTTLVTVFHVQQKMLFSWKSLRCVSSPRKQYKNRLVLLHPKLPLFLAHQLCLGHFVNADVQCLVLFPWNNLIALPLLPLTVLSRPWLCCLFSNVPIRLHLNQRHHLTHVTNRAYSAEVNVQKARVSLCIHDQVLDHISPVSPATVYSSKSIGQDHPRYTWRASAGARFANPPHSVSFAKRLSLGLLFRNQRQMLDFTTKSLDPWNRSESQENGISAFAKRPQH